MIYNQNGVHIDSYKNIDYLFSTKKYVLNIAVDHKKSLYLGVEFKTGGCALEWDKAPSIVNLSWFANFDENNIIIYSSAEMVDSAIDRILKLKAFL